MAASIECCRQERKAARTWLFSNLQQFEYEILFEAFCPNCKKPLMAHCYFINSVQGSTHIIKIPRKFHEGWLVRKQVDAFDIGEKDNRLIIFVGEGTIKMVRNPSRRNIKLHRFHPSRSLVSV